MKLELACSIVLSKVIFMKPDSRLDSSSVVGQEGDWHCFWVSHELSPILVLVER